MGRARGRNARQHRPMNRTDDLVRLAASAFRKYSRDPQVRAYSSRHLLSAALALCAEHNDLGEVSLFVAETLTTLKQSERAAERSAG